jgi:hypothetical protein
MNTNDDDLDAWLDALRGRPRAQTSAATRIEADAQRAALLQARAGQESEGEDAQQLQRLLFRLRREGLLGPESAAERSFWRKRLPLAAAATLALGLAITTFGPSIHWMSSEDDTVVRGGVAPQVVLSSDVADTVRRLEALLRGAGAAVAVSDLGDGAREVAATVPREQIDAVTPALAALGVKAPERSGALRVEVRPQR